MSESKNWILPCRLDLDRSAGVRLLSCLWWWLRHSSFNEWWDKRMRCHLNRSCYWFDIIPNLPSEYWDRPRLVSSVNFHRASHLSYIMSHRLAYLLDGEFYRTPRESLTKNMDGENPRGRNVRQWRNSGGPVIMWHNRAAPSVRLFNATNNLSATIVTGLDRDMNEREAELV